MAVQAPAQDTGGGKPEAFRFVQELATELSQGTVEVPGFPDVAAKVQRALADPELKADRLLRIVSVEPVLAARIMQMANSAALARPGGPVTELRTAITRLGFELLRSAALSYALEQLKRAPELRNIARPLHLLWQRSVGVAAICHGLARRVAPSMADTALLAGLLHSVGRLYILVRSSRHPTLFSDPGSYQCIVRDWHAAVAQALLENWKVPEEIVRAVAECDDLGRDCRGALDLTDLLATACLIAAHRNDPALLETQLLHTRVAARLALKSGDCEALLRETDGDLEALRSALGT